MRNLFQNFRKDEDGASLVEYAVALIVVTIVGGVMVLGIGVTTDSLATGACTTTQAAVTGVNTATGGALATGTC